MSKMENQHEVRGPPKRRRLTPADADWVFDEWLRLESYYMGHGLSAHEAHTRISQQFNCSWQNVYHHLKKTIDRVKAKPKSTPYSEIIKNPSARERYHRRHKEYRRFSRHPEHYLASVFSQSDREAMTLEDISLMIKEQYRFLPRISTLETVATQLHQKYGHPVVLEVPGSNPPLYKFKIDY